MQNKIGKHPIKNKGKNSKKLTNGTNYPGLPYLLNYLLGAEDLGVHFSTFGLHIIELVLKGHDVGLNSKLFPRVTMCDFQIRQFSNVQDYTVECSLPINLFSEKFFIFLWFWIVLVFFANIYSLLSWLWTVFSVSRVGYIKKYIKLVERMRKNELNRRHIACFADEYLRYDGIFCLRMLSSNTNDVTTAQVIAKLWNHYKTFHYDTEEFHKPHRRINEYDPEVASVASQPRERKPERRRSEYRPSSSSLTPPPPVMM